MALTHLFPATRWSMIERLQDTLSPAGLLVERYAPAIRAYLGLKFPGEAPEWIDDLAQEVMCALLEQPMVMAKALDDTKRRFRFYLMRVAFNLARNARRRLRDSRAQPQEVVWDATVEDDHEEQEVMDGAWAIAVLDQAFEDCRGWEQAGRLDPHAVAMLDANVRAGEGVRAIAARYDVSPATAARRIAAARQMLLTAICDHMVAAGEMDAESGKTEAFTILQAALRHGQSVGA